MYVIYIYIYIYILVALGLRRFILRRFTIRTILKIEGQIYKKSHKNFQKCATINTGYDIKKQHNQSEMTAIPIYHLSQSGMRLIKLLKYV